jgi:hypothetical protein
MVRDRLEIVFHQPLLDQVRLGQRAPDFLRRMRRLAFDNDGKRFGRGFRSSVHPSQQVFEAVEPALPEPGHLPCPVDQGGKRAELSAVMRLSPFMPVAHQPGLLENAEML